MATPWPRLAGACPGGAARSRRSPPGRLWDQLLDQTQGRLAFDPLPCWRHLSAERRQKRAAELGAKIEADAAARQAATGIPELGAEVVLRQRPHDRPNRPKKSPAPLLHVAAKAARQEMWEAYAWFVGAFRQAAEKLKAGDRMAAFGLGEQSRCLDASRWSRNAADTKLLLQDSCDLPGLMRNRRTIRGS